MFCTISFCTILVFFGFEMKQSLRSNYEKVERILRFLRLIATEVEQFFFSLAPFILTCQRFGDSQ